jgi:hypothetical protein
MSYRMVMTLAVSVSFSACSSPPEPPKKTVFDPMTQQIQKAKDVQGTADAQADSTRKAVDAQERGDDR